MLNSNTRSIFENEIKKNVEEIHSFISNSNWNGATKFPFPTIKFDYSDNRTCHRGGIYAKGPGINLAMKFILPGLTDLNYISGKEFKIRQFREYASIEHDPEIGTYYAHNPLIYAKGIVSHEVAHAYEMWEARHFNFGKKRKPHGIEWQNIYRYFRRNFVNPLLPDQKLAVKEYREAVETAKRALQNARQGIKTF